MKSFTGAIGKPIKRVWNWTQKKKIDLIFQKLMGTFPSVTSDGASDCQVANSSPPRVSHNPFFFLFSPLTCVLGII